MFYQHSLRLLRQRGVCLQDIATIAYDLQAPYDTSLTIEECKESVRAVLGKREVQHAIITGISIDQLAEQRKLPEPFQTIMELDEPLYGIDEVLALSITNVYGSIGLTSFGYLDKKKTGIIQQLNSHQKRIHVFLDDIVAGIAAAASARIAHKRSQQQQYVVVLQQLKAIGDEEDDLLRKD